MPAGRSNEAHSLSLTMSSEMAASNDQDLVTIHGKPLKAQLEYKTNTEQDAF